ncbi:MAG: lysophospholipid acyltransferase family protein [Candidatus Aminicenantales bacterium]
MRTILLALIYVILIIILAVLLLIAWPFGLRDPLLGIAKWAISLAPPILGIKVEVSGREHVDKRTPFIFMANHLSFIDGPLLFRLIPRPIRVILKKEVFRIPVIGQGMRFVGFVPVDRKGVRGGKKSIDHASRLMHEKGYSYLIFPEGTRSRDGRTQAFKRGGFFLAVESQAPIVPISIAGTYGLMPRGTIFPRRGRVEVRFHPPVPVRGYDQATLGGLIDKVTAVIESDLTA